MLGTSENHLEPSLDYMVGDLLGAVRKRSVFLGDLRTINIYLGQLKGIKI